MTLRWVNDGPSPRYMRVWQCLSGLMQQVTRFALTYTKEVTAPTRIVTSSVQVYGGKGEERMVPVKTASDIPKEKMMDVIRSLRGVSVPCPVKIGDVIVQNIAGTGVDVIATKNLE